MTLAERQHRWYMAHKDKKRERELGYRSRRAWRDDRRRFGGEAPDFAVWNRVWNAPCVFCGKDPAEGVDHRLPKALGGRNIAENLQACCRPCNGRKGRKEMPV